MTHTCLNLYAGIGGNRKLWGGVDVTAVEINPEVADVYRGLYPDDTVIVSDAHDYLLDHYGEYDFIWSSPPCQTHSKMNKANRHDLARYPDMALYQEVVFLREWFDGEWVVENVRPYYDPLIEPQRVGRHAFWASFPIPPIDIESPDNFSKTDKENLMDWLGIHFGENIYLDGNHDPGQVFRNAVHPKLGKHVFDAANTNQQATVDAFGGSP